jgi:hypothetical protein
VSQTIDPETVQPLEAIPVGTDRRGWLIVVASWLAVFLLVGVTGWWLWTRVINPNGGSIVHQYAHKNAGQTYESVADEFRATFPTTYHRNVEQSQYGPIVTVDSRPGPGYLFSVSRQPVPESALENYDTTLNNSAHMLVADAKAKITSQTKPLILGDFAIKNVAYQRGSHYWVLNLRMVKDRLYTLLTETPNSDKAPANRLNNSFVALGPR